LALDPQVVLAIGGFRGRRCHGLQPRSHAGNRPDHESGPSRHNPLPLSIIHSWSSLESSARWQMLHAMPAFPPSLAVTLLLSIP
jgi:hypothetical protein